MHLEHYLVKQLEKSDLHNPRLTNAYSTRIHDLHLVYRRLDSRRPQQGRVDKTIEQMQDVVRIVPEGDITDFLGVNIERKSKGEYVLTQPQLIDQIISGLRLDKSASSTKDIPMKSSTILDKGTGQPHLMDTFITEASSVSWDTSRKGAAPSWHTPSTSARDFVRTKETACGRT